MLEIVSNVVPRVLFHSSRGLRLVQARTQKASRPTPPGSTPMATRIAWSCPTSTSWWCWARAASARWGHGADVCPCHVAFTNACVKTSLCDAGGIVHILGGLTRISALQQVKDHSFLADTHTFFCEISNFCTKETWWRHLRPQDGNYRKMVNIKMHCAQVWLSNVS